MNKFPIYRKYKNNSSWFRVNSLDSFDEIKKVGEKYYLFHFEVKILPDRNFISDMLNKYEEHWDVISEDDFDSALKEVRPT